MSVEATYRVRCDHPGCTVTGPEVPVDGVLGGEDDTASVVEAEAEARKESWFAQNFEHYCPEHKNK